ncbi:MAG: hypothetical protein U0V73_16540 [Acidimicrobiia bacterium]
MTLAVAAGCSSGTAKHTATAKRSETRTTTTAARAHATTTTTPAPAGYAVGKRTETFVDTTRATPRNGTYPGAPSRTLSTTIYYPATGDPSEPAAAGAPVDRRGAPYPLVLFSHGVGARALFYEGLLRQWVRAGYVVAAPDYPLSNTQSPGGSTIRDVQHQPADASFVIDRVLALDAADGGLGGIVDPNRIGAAGHSLGAVTTFGLSYSECCADARIKAAIPMSGVAVLGTSEFFRTHHAPLLLLHGDADETVPYQGSVDAYAKASAPKYFVTILGGGHSPPFLGLDQQPATLVVDGATLDFLDAYLKGRTSELARLRTDAQVPGVSTLQETTG